MKIRMLVITGPAAHLRDLTIHHGDDRVVRQPAALDAMVVYDIAESKFHFVSPGPMQYSRASDGATAG